MTSIVQMEIAGRKRSKSSPSQPPPRSCIICTEPESEVHLVRPCRSCSTDYCTTCLASMFEEAITDRTRMPPRCCNLIQIHTILGSDLLSDNDANAYCEKFEEWITPTKTYCPSPTCSVFIPDRKLPQTASAPAYQVPSLQSVFSEILEKVIKSSPARFFRVAIDKSQAPNYDQIVKTPMDLSIIKKRLLTSRYKTFADLTMDIRLIVENARKYNGDKHPVTKTAKELVGRYLEEAFKAVSKVMDRIEASRNVAAEKIFACPKCHIAICTSCKQIEHSGTPCDTSAQDHELAMLETFGYKRCPRCKAGVKKMFGCSHMQCVCGAHWCYYCQRSIEQCDGACEAREFEDEEEDYDSEDDMGPEMIESQPDDRTTSTGLAPPTSTRPRSGVATAAIDPTEALTLHDIHALAAGRSAPVLPNQIDPAARISTLQGDTAPVSQNETAPAAPVNLDVGGPGRWAEGNYDFGEEPEDDGIAQIWSCKHKFEIYESPPDDGINRGDLDQMECNRCFIAVLPKWPEPKSTSKKRRKLSQSQGSKIDPILIKDDTPSPPAKKKDIAWECVRCKLVVCVLCRDKYPSVQED